MKAIEDQSNITFEQADASWGRLRNLLKDYDVALFLGAGLSIPNGLPSWQSLTSRLANLDLKTVQLFESNKVGLTTQLQLAKDQVTVGKKWIEKVREAMYCDMISEINKMSKIIPGLSTRDFGRKNLESRKRVYNFFLETNPVLLRIVNACSVIEENGDRITNDRIGAILTTNYDNLIQLCDRACHGTPRMLRTVERPIKEGDAEKISLYHLHGYLQMKPSTLDDEASDRLVLTEDEYLERNDDPYSWASVLLHWSLREFSLVFVGCSMTDELVRRALRRSVRERIRHLQATRSKGLEEHEWRRQFAVVKWDKKGEVSKAVNANLAFLGVWPLWVENYDADLSRRMSDLGLADPKATLEA
jgi:hypothetical protein